MFKSPPGRDHDPFARFPAEVRDAFLRFRDGDPDALRPVLSAVVRDFMPRPDRAPAGPLPPTAVLVEDLGFDSLALAEIVFFMEDTFDVRISSEEIQPVRTLGDLDAFIRRKLAAATAPKDPERPRRRPLSVQDASPPAK